jgi:hypothetical protein
MKTLLRLTRGVVSRPRLGRADGEFCSTRRWAGAGLWGAARPAQKQCCIVQRGRQEDFFREAGAHWVEMEREFFAGGNGDYESGRERIFTKGNEGNEGEKGLSLFVEGFRKRFRFRYEFCRGWKRNDGCVQDRGLAGCCDVEM